MSAISVGGGYGKEEERQLLRATHVPAVAGLIVLACVPGLLGHFWPHGARRELMVEAEVAAMRGRAKGRAAALAKVV